MCVVAASSYALVQWQAIQVSQGVGFQRGDLIKLILSVGSIGCPGKEKV